MTRELPSCSHMAFREWRRARTVTPQLPIRAVYFNSTVFEILPAQRDS